MVVVGVPSSVTIAEEEDMHVCEVPLTNTNTNNISIDPTPSSICTISPLESLPIIPTDLPISKSNKCLINPNELPFDYLAGEEFIEHGVDITDGIIYLTTYRLFIFTTESCCSFINCPIRLIDSIEIKDNIYLYIQCKDIRSFRLTFFQTDKCCYWLRKLTEIISIPTCLEDLFAIKFALAIPNQDHSLRDHFNDELIRLQLDTYPWRLTEINRNYKLCTSYPEFCVVPSTITDDEIGEVAKFRSYRRFPTIVWRHNNGAVIARTSQPEVGWLFWRSKEDEKMIQAIINACNNTSTDSIPRETNSNRLLILDARSYAAAIANRAKGGGFEYPPYYTDCDVQFMNLPNIHAIRKSAQMLRAAITNAAQGENWLSQLESTRWLHNLSALIGAASFVVANVDKNNRPVLVHCSDGWDRTPQITTLAEIMLDSYYRTIEGFQILVQREWIAFGHKFGDRCGHGIGANDSNERSPVFLQWLDCIYQLFMQNPVAFEFNEMFLVRKKIKYILSKVNK
jgi:myotubularin-related protein 3/4